MTEREAEDRGKRMTVETGYRMWCYGPTKACICEAARSDRRVHKAKCPFPGQPWEWEPMDKGAAASVWYPRETALLAAIKAYRWSGGLPAMRVTAPNGLVEWQYDFKPREAQARGWITWAEDSLARWDAEHTPEDQPGPNVLPPWHADVRLAVHGATERTVDDLLDSIDLHLTGGNG